MPFVAVLNHPHNAARLRITEAMFTLSLLVFCIRELRFSPQNQSIQIFISIRRITEKEEPLFPRGAKTSHVSSICFWLEVSVQILHRKCRWTQKGEEYLASLRRGWQDLKDPLHWSHSQRQVFLGFSLCWDTCSAAGLHQISPLLRDLHSLTIRARFICCYLRLQLFKV